ncbi:RNA recognition motif domain [Dillenia turbinata]|uniref:RNA recognition motif domain n=1 Tax=Dillenia turbinata TaxID=194707 RepID=A0AAN8USZ5_9MAGN
MPPRAIRRHSNLAPLKKRPPPVLDEPLEPLSTPPGEVDPAEKLQLEENVAELELEEENLGCNGKESREVEGHKGDRENGGEERIHDIDINQEYIEEVEEEVVYEDDAGEEHVGDEHDDGVDGYEEHHEVAKARRKQKEYEVFVGGLDREATEDDLKKVFSQVGEIVEVRLTKNPITLKNKGFAFLRFVTVEQARRAINELKHPMINGKHCGVAPVQDSDTLFVGNICKTWTKDILKEKLARYGVDKFEDLTLVEDTRNEGMNRGFAFLDFYSRADAIEACKCLQRRDVVFGMDRTAKVAFADSFIEPDDEIMAQVKTVFLDGLPVSWNEDQVKEHLKKYGKIEKVELARNMPAAKRTDFGFVTFDSHDAAVACINSVNNAEVGDGNNKDAKSVLLNLPLHSTIFVPVKLRARLSRPRQRSRSAKHARGGYLVSHGSSRGEKAIWSSNRSYMDSRRLTSHDDRAVKSRNTYDGTPRRSSGLTERHMVMDVGPTKVGSRRGFPSPDRSLSRRSPVSYSKSSSRREYLRAEEYYSRPTDYARDPADRRIYRDANPSHVSGYLESPPRTLSRVAPRRISPYDEGNYGRLVERPSAYRDSHNHDYSSIPGSKRPHADIEELHPRYPDSSIRQSRARYHYGGSSSTLPYDENSYGSDSISLRRGSRSEYLEDSRRPAGGYSQGQYDSYRRDDISRRDPELVYSGYGRELAQVFTLHSTQVAMWMMPTLAAGVQAQAHITESLLLAELNLRRLKALTLWQMRGLVD